MQSGLSEDLRPITGHGTRPLQIAVLASGSGSNLQALLDAQARCDPLIFKVVAVFSDKDSFALKRAEALGLHVVKRLYRPFCRERCLDPACPSSRIAYDQEILRELRRVEAVVGSIDVLVLAGYMRLVRAPLLQAFPQRIINVHPADLAAMSAEGKRNYIGINAVADALAAGEQRTRSSVILVDPEVDGGPVLVSGPGVDRRQGAPLDAAYVHAHQERQKRESDWPALVFAVEALARGEFSLNEGDQVFYKALPLGAEGVDLSAFSTGSLAGMR
jgi:phosphoribosylglycinamide formyltransferase-1